MGAELMARRKKRSPQSLAIAQAILEQYQPKTTEDVQEALKDAFGRGVSKAEALAFAKSEVAKMAAKYHIKILGYRYLYLLVIAKLNAINTNLMAFLNCYIYQLLDI